MAALSKEEEIALSKSAHEANKKGKAYADFELVFLFFTNVHRGVGRTEYEGKGGEEAG